MPLDCQAARQDGTRLSPGVSIVWRFVRPIDGRTRDSVRPNQADWMTLMIITGEPAETGGDACEARQTSEPR